MAQDLLLKIVGGVALLGFNVWLGLGAYDLLKAARKIPKIREALLRQNEVLERRITTNQADIRELEGDLRALAAKLTQVNAWCVDTKAQLTKRLPPAPREK